MTDPLVVLGRRLRELAREHGVDMETFTLAPDLDGDAHTVKVLFVLPEMTEVDIDAEAEAFAAEIEAHERDQD